LAAAQPTLNFTLLDHYLVQAEYADIPAVVCVNKLDLQDADNVRMLYTQAGYAVCTVSTKTQAGLDELAAWLAGKTTVLAGPSGVGKSSLLNCLSMGVRMETGGLSTKIDRGKHTTRHAELISIRGSGYVIDTPGFSSVALPDVPMLERAALFREFRPFLGDCQFSNCLHYAEKGCAVKAQVGVSIDPQRYARYVDWITKNG
jgi:ribosome biogenesis GTPase